MTEQEVWREPRLCGCAYVCYEMPPAGTQGLKKIQNASCTALIENHVSSGELEALRVVSW